jgi:glycosyltransferase involved in cell wall biosynthesis
VTTCGFGPAPEGVDHVQVPDAAKGWWPRMRGAALLLLARRFNAFYRRSPQVAAAYAALKDRTFDVIVANDLDTVPLALALRPRRGVHVDLHEWEPRTPADTWQWRRYAGPLTAWELRQVRRAASVTTVAPGIAARYRQVHGIEATVVTNATRYVDLEPTEVAAPLRIVHSGGAMPYRQLEILIDAVRLTPADVTLDFYLVPSDPAYLAALKDRAADLPNVQFHEPVPFRDLVPTMATYDLGIHVLPPTSTNNALALPNKLFEYVQARLGVVVGPSPEMAAIVDDLGLGAVTSDFTPEAVAATLARLTPDDVRRFKQNAHVSARPLSAEEQVGGWARAVEALLGAPLASRASK